MIVYHPDDNATPKSPPSSDSAICTWPSCGHTAKGQCRGAVRRIQLFTDDQLAAAVADAIARAERAEAALAVAEESLSEISRTHNDQWIAGRTSRTALAKIAEIKGGSE